MPQARHRILHNLGIQAAAETLTSQKVEPETLKSLLFRLGAFLPAIG
jgi:hypothetical protein